MVVYVKSSNQTENIRYRKNTREHVTWLPSAHLCDLRVSFAWDRFVSTFFGYAYGIRSPLLHEKSVPKQWTRKENLGVKILMNEVMRSGWTRSCTEFEAKLGTFGPYRLILNTNVNRYPDEGRTRYHEQDGEKLCGPARCKQSRKRVALK